MSVFDGFGNCVFLFKIKKLWLWRWPCAESRGYLESRGGMGAGEGGSGKYDRGRVTLGPCRDRY